MTVHVIGSVEVPERVREVSGVPLHGEHFPGGPIGYGVWGDAYQIPYGV